MNYRSVLKRSSLELLLFKYYNYYMVIRMNAIKTTDLCKYYKDVKAVNKVNLEIKEGELFGLLGVNGAGKTTLIKMLSGLIKSTSGEIDIFKMKYPEDTIDIKKILNISPQETAIAPNLTVIEKLEFMAGIYLIKDKDKKIKELVNIFNLDNVLNKKTKNLSGGWQRKLSLAISLINEPKILFLDEPTLGLDVISRKELWNILDSLKGKMTIILTTHYMEEAEYLSDRIGVINSGSLITINTPKELLKKTKTKKLEDAFIKIVGGSL